MESKKEGNKINDLNIIKGDKKIIDTKITYENISNEDIAIINKYITPKEKKFWNNYPMNELSYKLKQFQDLIFKKSNFIKNIEFSKQNSS